MYGTTTPPYVHEVGGEAAAVGGQHLLRGHGARLVRDLVELDRVARHPLHDLVGLSLRGNLDRKQKKKKQQYL